MGWMNEQDVMAWWLRNCYAPCAVADHFSLRGKPFTTVAKAKAALRREIFKKARLDPVVISKYSSWELALVVQFDINGQSAPLPAESLSDDEKRLVFAERILADANVSGLDRRKRQRAVTTKLL